MSILQNRRSFSSLGVAFALCVGLASGSSQADQLLTNGGFETGSFTGWLLANPEFPQSRCGQCEFNCGHS